MLASQRDGSASRMIDPEADRMKAGAGAQRRWRSIFRRGSAASDAAVLAIGAVAGQLVTLLLSPLLTRLFTPDEIGVLGVFTSIVAVLSVVAPLGYDQAILGSRHSGEALRYVAASMLSGTALCLLLPLLGFWALHVLSVLSEPWFMVPFIALGTIPAIAMTSAQAWYIRARRTASVGAGSFVNMSARTIIQIGAGWFRSGVLGLMGGEVVGRLLAVLVLDRGQVIRRATMAGLRAPTSILRQMRRGRAFALFQMPSSALDVVLVWAPLPLVAYAYGAEWAGIVTLVQRIGSAPASLIGQSLVQIYHQRAAQYVHTDRPRLFKLTLKLMAGALAMFVPLWLAFALVAPWLFGTVFGADWNDAGRVAVIWAPLILLQIFSQLASRMLILVHRQFVRLIANATQVVALTGVILGGAWLGYDLIRTLTIMVGVCSALYCAYVATALAYYRR